MYEHNEPGAQFSISGEAGDGLCDYWQEFTFSSTHDDFGISHRVNTILERSNLRAEWINPGIVGVYTL